MTFKKVKAIPVEENSNCLIFNKDYILVQKGYSENLNLNEELVQNLLNLKTNEFDSSLNYSGIEFYDSSLVYLDVDSSDSEFDIVFKTNILVDLG